MNQRLEGRPSTSGNVDRQTLARTYQNLRDDRMPSGRPTGSLFGSFLSSCLRVPEPAEIGVERSS